MNGMKRGDIRRKTTLAGRIIACGSDLKIEARPEWSDNMARLR